MIDLNEVVNDVKSKDLGVTIWACAGEEYKIQMLNGDLIGQDKLVIVADKYDDEIQGTPTQIAKIIGDFMFELLILQNDVTRVTAGKIANPKTVSEVYGLWLGLK